MMEKESQCLANIKVATVSGKNSQGVLKLVQGKYDERKIFI
jgi:hypothetical protein